MRLKDKYEVLVTAHSQANDQLLLHQTYLSCMEQNKPPYQTAEVTLDSSVEFVLRARLYHIGRLGHGWDLVVVNQYDGAGKVIPWATLLINYQRFQETRENAWRPICQLLDQLRLTVDTIANAA